MIDLSTLNKDKIQTLPTSSLTIGTPEQGSHVSAQMGMCCFMDPPGYPTYFMRPCYNKNSITPGHMPQAVITEFGRTHVVIPSEYATWKNVKNAKDWDEYKAKLNEFIHSLWVPLPYEHPRVQAWILAVYNYFRNCYVDPDTGASNVCFWPSKSMFLRVGNNEWRSAPKFTYYDFDLAMDRRAYLAQKWKDNKAYRKAIGKANAVLLQRVKKIAADPRNSRAFQHVRRFYPEHNEPLMDLIKNPPPLDKGGAENWWAIYEAVPRSVN